MASTDTAPAPVGSVPFEVYRAAEYARSLNEAKELRMDQAPEGGVRFIVDGQVVDCNGQPVDKPTRDERDLARETAEAAAEATRAQAQADAEAIAASARSRADAEAADILAKARADAAAIVAAARAAAAGDAPDLEAMTIPELKGLAEQRGIEIPSDARKPEIVAALVAAPRE